MNWQDELKNIDWENLKANGFAGDIPQIIKDLFSTEKDKEEHQYLEELEDYIYHQGTIYEAASFVLSFLFELLKKKKGEIKIRIFFIIAIIYEHGYKQEPIKDIELEISKNKDKIIYFVDNIEDEESRFLCEYTLESFEKFASMIKK